MMRDELPFALALHKNICGLHQSIVEAVGEGAGDLLGAGDPADVAFGANPYGAERDFHAPRVRKYAHVAFAHFFPAEQQVPARMHALHPVFMGPDFLERGEIHGFEGGVETPVRVAKGLLGSNEC